MAITLVRDVDVLLDTLVEAARRRPDPFQYRWALGMPEHQVSHPGIEPDRRIGVHPGALSRLGDLHYVHPAVRTGPTAPDRADFSITEQAYAEYDRRHPAAPVA